MAVVMRVVAALVLMMIAWRLPEELASVSPSSSSCSTRGGGDDDDDDGDGGDSDIANSPLR